MLLPPVRFSTTNWTSRWVFDLGGNQPREGVHAAARRDRHDDADGTVGKARLRAQDARRQRPCPPQPAAMRLSRRFMRISGRRLRRAGAPDIGCPAPLHHCGRRRMADIVAGSPDRPRGAPWRRMSDSDHRPCAAARRQRSARSARWRARSTRPARDTGFFMVTGHGVPAELIATTRQRAIDFFALPEDEKMKVAAAAGEDQPRLQLGRRPLDRLFDGPGGAARHPGGLRVRPRPRRDLRREVDQASAQMYAPNIWPERPDDFKHDHAGLLRRDVGPAHRTCCARWRSRSVSTRAISPTSSTARRASCASSAIRR